MKRLKEIVKNFIVKNGANVAAFAFAFAAISANTSCCFPYYEPVEPKNLKNFKKFNK